MNLEFDRSTFDHKNEEKHKFKAIPGINEKVVREISKDKNEPDWILQKRLKSLEWFNKTPMMNWGPSLEKLDLNSITYYIKPDANKNSENWEDVPEDIKKTFERLGIPEAERKMLSGVGAQYECLSENSLVWTNPKGHTRIKDIRIGDSVFSLDEKTDTIKKAKVLSVKSSGKKNVFEIQVGLRKLRASDNHPFLVLDYKKEPGKKRGRYKRVWKSLKELKRGDLISIATSIPDYGKSFTFEKPNFRTHAISKNQFGTEIKYKINYNEVSLPGESDIDTMWFLGLFLGDGYMKKERGREKARVNIAIPETQKTLRQELKKVIRTVFGENLISEYKYYISINSTIVAKFLNANGFSGNAHTKTIPFWIHSIPKKQKLAFLGGYLDSDGTVRKKEGDVIFTSVNRNLLKESKKIADYCDLNSSNINKFESKHPFDSSRKIKGYRLSLTGKLTEIGSRYDFKKKRLGTHKYYHKNQTAKGTDFRKHCSDYLGFAKLKSVKKIGIKPVYDIQVEGFHNFIAEGIVVHNSEIVYHKLKKEWEDKGVVFLDMDEAVKQYPDLVKKYFMTSCVPINDHKFVMLHGAVWSGGTFIYVPEGVKVNVPLQAYFRMNAKKMGQFEHTLIIADKNSEVHYIEGCSAPQYTQSSLHAGCVEIFVKEGARVRYSSVENWSKNTYNLNTKRAIVDKDGIIEWIGGNMGSGVTMLYPCSMLRGEGSSADHIAIAFAGKGQEQDTGAKVFHLASNTSSTIRSKSISKDGGIANYRGMLKTVKGAKHIKSNVECDALLLDDESKTNTWPFIEVKENEVDIGHEATVGKISEDQIFYLMSRGLKEEEAKKLIVSGFIEPITKLLPLEYAVELNRLIELEMEGSVG